MQVRHLRCLGFAATILGATILAAPVRAESSMGSGAAMPVMLAANEVVYSEALSNDGGDRSDRYQGLIARHARANGVPVGLAHAVIRVESNYNARARGGAGEVGLMQIKPSTARIMGFSGAARALYDPNTNLTWGMQYLAEAYRLAGGSVCGTILRYNAGHAARRMNPISARYCRRVQAILKGSGSRLASL